MLKVSFAPPAMPPDAAAVEPDSLAPAHSNADALEAQFQAQLNSAHLTRPMWMLWILSAGLIALDGFDFFVIGVAMPFIQRDFSLSAGWVGVWPRLLQNPAIG